jgi:hypothetical protein
VQVKFPDGVEEILKTVGKRLKKKEVMGASGDADEDAMLEVINLIQTKWMNIDPTQTMATVEWAAKQYLKLLLIDWRRLGYFRDHELCDPQK